MRQFYQTEDHQLLEINSENNFTSSELSKYVANTSANLDTLYLPIIRETPAGYKVIVNTNCTQQHDIVFIELDLENLRIKRYLKENEKPEVNFIVKKAHKVKAYVYSKSAGLWVNSLQEDA